ncbi:hypothetical protein AB0C76_30800 [Kitasatospora sp. NPDC048722]|uniref:hypothetical protein n=1 Tax=Kitasatospora sp. NPDC048722 TaxID=3155639 RepID=UPI0033F20266
MKPRDDFDEDFGLTGLTKYLAMHLTLRDEAACLDLAERLFEREGPVYAQEVLDDARRLERSRLPDVTLSTLWLAAARARFDPAGAGLGIRAWLRRVEDTCAAFVRQDEPSFSPSLSPADPDPGLRTAVLAEVRGVGPALAEAAVTSVYVPPLPGLVPALAEAVDELGADLGFRLFLRAVKVYFVPIGPARLGRFEEIGRRLGYHEWVVEDGNLNIWSDLED